MPLFAFSQQPVVVSSQAVCVTNGVRTTRTGRSARIVLCREDGVGKGTIPTEHSRNGETIPAKQAAKADYLSAYYQRQRERGKEHHAAVRALAFKWNRVLFRCWQDRVAYDESRYLTALAKRGSHLTSAFVAASVSM
jgi:hypothetical protein